MANHLRVQIRDALKALLTGLPNVGSNVLTLRLGNSASSSLPLLEITVGDEVDGLASTLGEMDRSCEIEVRMLALETTDVEAELGNILADIERTVQTDPTLGDLVDLIYPVTISAIVPDGSGADPVGAQIITFKADYQTIVGVPDASV